MTARKAATSSTAATQEPNITSASSSVPLDTLQKVQSSDRQNRAQTIESERPARVNSLFGTVRFRIIAFCNDFPTFPCLETFSIVSGDLTDFLHMGVVLSKATGDTFSRIRCYSLVYFSVMSVGVGRGGFGERKVTEGESFGPRLALSVYGDRFQLVDLIKKGF